MTAPLNHIEPSRHVPLGAKRLRRTPYNGAARERIGSPAILSHKFRVPREGVREASGRAGRCAQKALTRASKGLDSYAPNYLFSNGRESPPSIVSSDVLNASHAHKIRHGALQCPSRKPLEEFFGERT